MMMLHLHSTKIKGFTLIELMIAVAIVGILAAIALPSYKNNIRKTKRQVAISDMLLYQQAQEKYRTNNLTYAPIGSLTGSYGINKSSNAADYTFTIDNGTTGGTPTGTYYRISATPLGNQALGSETECNPIRLSSDNGRSPQICWAK